MARIPGFLARLGSLLRIARRDTSSALGSDLAFTRGLATLGYRALRSPPQGTFFERSVLAARVLWGSGSEAMPVDLFFAPGGSPEMEYPLRARRQREDGILGATPLGRRLLIGNDVEEAGSSQASCIRSILEFIFYDIEMAAIERQGSNTYKKDHHQSNHNGSHARLVGKNV